MKKKIFALILVLCLIVQPVVESRAQNMEVTDVSASMTGRTATVTGNTEALAVMVRITDEAGNLAAMQSFPVSSDMSFSAVISGVSFASGTYTIAVADYEGGPWAVVTATVTNTPSGGSSGDDTPSEPGGSEGGSAPAEGQTSEPAFEEVVTDEEGGSAKAVFDAGVIGEEPSDMSFAIDPEDEKDAEFLNDLIEGGQLGSYAGEPVEIILSVSKAELSSEEEAACSESMDALEAMISGGKAAGSVSVPDELEALVSGTLSAPADKSGKTDKPEIKIAQVFDFKVIIKVGDQAPVEIHDLGVAKMVVKFLIDEKFKNTDPLVQRIFFMLHLKDDGTTEALTVDLDTATMQGTLAFDSCSPFVLAYTDVARFSEAGDTLKSAKYNAKYRVIEGGDTAGRVGTLEYIAPIRKKASHTVSSKVRIDGITYRVKSIAANAFKGNKKVEKVVIGQYVTSIGTKAFYGCTSLKNVTIGKRVSLIGAGAFRKAKALRKVTIKSGRLKSANIGKSVWPKAKITFVVPAAKLKSYTKLFGKFGKVKAN